MALHRVFDRTFIGQNYLSFITALAFLRRKESVLLIDDNRVNFDSLWGHYLNYLDLQYLQLWGIIDDIEELKGLRQYLRKVPITFYVGASPFYLPGSPFDNLNECLRRFPDVFVLSEDASNQSRQDFDQTYYHCMEHLAEVSFRFKNLQTIRHNFLEGIKWPYFDRLLKQLYGKYRELLRTQPEHPFIHFLYLAKSLYHREILFELSEFEVGHLLLCLLGPVYQMKHKRLEEDLQEKFQAMGGHLKQSAINSWQIYQNQLTHIELDSFEGVIAPNQCYFMGHLSPEFPFTNALYSEGYRGIYYKIRSSGVFDLIEGKRILYSRENHLGGDIPFIDFYGFSPRMLYAWVPYRNRLGSKHTFYQKQIKTLLDEALKNILIRQVEGEMIEREVEESQTFWIHREGLEFEKNYHIRRKKLKLMENIGPLKQSPINRFSYWGPLRCYSVGLFSYLVELKDYLQLK